MMKFNQSGESVVDSRVFQCVAGYDVMEGKSRKLDAETMLFGPSTQIWKGPLPNIWKASSGEHVSQRDHSTKNKSASS
jgi:hypothetical protein